MLGWLIRKEDVPAYSLIINTEVGSMKKILLIATMTLWAVSAHAANWYVDCAVSSSGNGQSWSSAWKSFSSVTGLSAGDIVYISGSSSCSTYAMSGWSLPGGTSSSYITYRVGQDAGHNSPVTITNSGYWITSGITGVYIDGNYNGNRNLTITNAVIANSAPLSNFRFSYINVTSPWTVGAFTKLEIDHCYWDLAINSDHVFSSNSGGSGGYTGNLIHDNVFRLRYRHGVNASGGDGDDGFQWLSNTSFYNNIIVGVYDSSYSAGQHADAIQTGGNYMAIYNNYFENMSNSMIYGEFYGSAAHWRIYNNVFNFSDSFFIGTAWQPSVVLECANSGLTLSDMTIANNTMYGGGYGVYAGHGSCSTISSSYIVNNIIYGAQLSPLVLTTWNGTASNNTTTTTGIYFVNAGSNISYPTADFHLQSTSTAAIDQGISPTYLTSVYTTDKDGTSRPQGSAWDIGAYEFATGSGSVAPMPPTALTIN